MTTIPAGYTVAPLTPEHMTEIAELERWAFPTSRTTEETLRHMVAMPWERMTGLRDPAGELAAMASSWDFRDFTLPGAVAAVPGFSFMAVHPGHRRRGLMTALVGLHFERALARGEALSALTASETGIYGRFGYGVALSHYSAVIPRQATLRPVQDADVSLRIETADAARHAAAANRVLAAAAWSGGLTRPGWIPRTEAQTAAEWVDVRAQRQGYEPPRILLAERAGGLVGYALFQRHENIWSGGAVGGKVKVFETVALDPAAGHAIWSALLDLDLTSAVEAELIPPCDPIIHLLVDVAGAKVALHDFIWLRLLDVKKALTLRQYAADVDVVLEVADERLTANAGRYRLTAAAFASGAVAERTDAPADLTVDVATLARAYLGETSLADLAAAGQVGELTPGALARASVAFGWPVAPGCTWVF